MIIKKILNIVILWGCAISLCAQTSLEGATEDAPVEIKMGECYLLPMDFFSNAYFTFQSKTDGLLYLSLSKPIRIFGQQGPLPIFDKQCVQGIKAGKVYTFYNTTTWGDSITMTPSFVEGKPYLPVSVVSTSIADGDTYRTTLKDGDVTFSFNVGINSVAVKVEVELSDGERFEVNNYRVSEDYSTQGTNYVVEFAEYYEQLLKDEKLKAGDSFKLILSNIVSVADAENRYDGEVVLNLKASGEAVKLVSVNKGETLQSYYMPGDEEGLIKMTFSAPITCQTKYAILAYGDREAGTWTEVNIPYTINENTLVWNVQGIHLTDVPVDNEGNRIASISLRGLCDAEGYPVESNAEGTIGTILFSYLIETIDINIYPDIIPVAGSNIDQTKEIEIWISAGKYVTFSGAKITYLSNGKITELLLPLEQLRLEDDPFSETDQLIYVPVETIEFEAGDVTVELTDVSAANGTNPEIKVTYTSTGKGSSSVHIPTNKPTAIATYQLNGTPINGQLLKKGVYLQQMTDGSVHKLIIR